MSAKQPTATPVDEMPFSNSDEGCAFTANWCDRCIHDKPARQNRIEQAWGVPPSGGSPAPPIDRYHCVEFRDENEPPSPRTEPLPTPPGQGELIPVEPYVGTRMFADAVTEVQPEVAQP